MKTKLLILRWSLNNSIERVSSKYSLSYDIKTNICWIWAEDCHNETNDNTVVNIAGGIYYSLSTSPRGCLKQEVRLSGLPLKSRFPPSLEKEDVLGQCENREVLAINSLLGGRGSVLTNFYRPGSWARFSGSFLIFFDFFMKGTYIILEICKLMRM